MKVLRIVLSAFVALLLVVAVALFVLTRPTDSPRSCSMALDVVKVRALAAAAAAERPTQIRVEQVGSYRFPGALVRAGASLGWVEMAVYAYRLDFRDHHILLDVAMTQAQAKESQAWKFDTAAHARLTRAITSAAAIYVTHEHADHVGSALVGPRPLPQLHLTAEQIASDRNQVPMAAEFKRALLPLRYEQMTRLGPGLVAIKAPGHTPGSQWFFVSKADGTELLFVGDTAWQMTNIEHEQGPPRLTSLMLKNDRDANACQLMTLQQLRQHAPEVQIVPGHDRERIAALIASGALTARF